MFTKHVFLTFFALFVLCCNVFSVPARRVARGVKQKDGTHLTVYLFGDEHFHCYVTADAFPVVERDGGFYYADVVNGGLVATDVLAHERNGRSAAEREFCRGLGDEVWEKIDVVWSKKRERVSVNGRNRLRSVRGAGGLTGKKKGLVLLVNFTDLSMLGSDPRGEFDMQFNQLNYSKNNHIGSVSDYFFDQSYGAFELSFDVVGPLNVSNDFAYYGRNSMKTDDDSHPATMVAEACKLVDEKVNFADYDWDGDGEVEQVFVVYAGYGESSGAPSNTIWPHKYSLSSALYRGDGEGALVLDGVKVDTYACTCELAGVSGGLMAGIGTACHEFSHCLGLPDLYDTRYRGGVGMSYWDVMCKGSNSGPSGNGEVPCGYSAFERYLLGWLDITRLDGPTMVKNMPCLGDTAVAYAFYNENDENEFFLLENRQNDGWFSYVDVSNDAHGMLVTHIDYDASVWESNGVNDKKNHQRMSFVPADNSYGYYYESGGRAYYYADAAELAGDPFPGSKMVNVFNGDSHAGVGGLYFNQDAQGEYSIKTSMEYISESDGLISFWFDGGRYVPSPMVVEPTDVTASSFTANWSVVDEADCYNVEITNVFRQEIVIQYMRLNEGFAKFKNEDVDDGVVEVSGVLDRYTTVPGWGGYLVYASSHGAVIDGGVAFSGFLTTPFMTVEDQWITLKFSAKGFDERGADVRLVFEPQSIGRVVEEVIHVTDSMMDWYVVVRKSFADKFCRVRISSPDGVCIGSLAVYDGAFSEEDLDVAKLFMQKRYRMVVEGVTDVSCGFNNLDTIMYRYRVQAVADSFVSKWSAYRYVSLTNSVGVGGVFADAENDDCIYYSLSGRRVVEPLAPGIYIRKGKRGCEKIVIK